MKKLVSVLACGLSLLCGATDPRVMSMDSDDLQKGIGVVTNVDLSGLATAAQVGSNVVKKAFSYDSSSVEGAEFAEKAKTAKEAGSAGLATRALESDKAGDLKDPVAFFDDAGTGKVKAVTAAFSNAVSRSLSENDPYVSSWARKIGGQDAPRPVTNVSGIVSSVVSESVKSFSETGSVKRVSYGTDELFGNLSHTYVVPDSGILADSYKFFENVNVYGDVSWHYATPKTVGDIGRSADGVFFDDEDPELRYVMSVYIDFRSDGVYVSETNHMYEGVSEYVGEECVCEPKKANYIGFGMYTTGWSSPVTQQEIDESGGRENLLLEYTGSTGQIAFIVVTNGTSVVVPGHTVTNRVSVESPSDVHYDGTNLVTREGHFIPVGSQSGIRTNSIVDAETGWTVASRTVGADLTVVDFVDAGSRSVTNVVEISVPTALDVFANGGITALTSVSLDGSGLPKWSGSAAYAQGIDKVIYDGFGKWRVIPSSGSGITVTSVSGIDPSKAASGETVLFAAYLVGSSLTSYSMAFKSKNQMTTSVVRDPGLTYVVTDSVSAHVKTGIVAKVDGSVRAASVLKSTNGIDLGTGANGRREIYADNLEITNFVIVVETVTNRSVVSFQYPYKTYSYLSTGTGTGAQSITMTLVSTNESGKAHWSIPTSGQYMKDLWYEHSTETWTADSGGISPPESYKPAHLPIAEFASGTALRFERYGTGPSDGDRIVVISNPNSGIYGTGTVRSYHTERRTYPVFSGKIGQNGGSSGSHITSTGCTETVISSSVGASVMTASENALGLYRMVSVSDKSILRVPGLPEIVVGGTVTNGSVTEGRTAYSAIKKTATDSVSETINVLSYGDGAFIADVSVSDTEYDIRLPQIPGTSMSPDKYIGDDLDVYGVVMSNVSWDVYVKVGGGEYKYSGIAEYDSMTVTNKYTYSNDVAVSKHVLTHVNWIVRSPNQDIEYPMFFDGAGPGKANGRLERIRLVMENMTGRPDLSGWVVDLGLLEKSIFSAYDRERIDYAYCFDQLSPSVSLMYRDQNLGVVTFSASWGDKIVQLDVPELGGSIRFVRRSSLFGNSVKTDSVATKNRILDKESFPVPFVTNPSDSREFVSYDGLRQYVSVVTDVVDRAYVCVTNAIGYSFESGGLESRLSPYFEDSRRIVWVGPMYRTRENQGLSLCFTSTVAVAYYKDGYWKFARDVSGRRGIDLSDYNFNVGPVTSSVNSASIFFGNLSFSDDDSPRNYQIRYSIAKLLQKEVNPLVFDRIVSTDVVFSDSITSGVVRDGKSGISVFGSAFRGSFPNWQSIPYVSSGYESDPSGNMIPRSGDFIVLSDSSDYGEMIGVDNPVFESYSSGMTPSSYVRTASNGKITAAVTSSGDAAFSEDGGYTWRIVPGHSYFGVEYYDGKFCFLPSSGSTIYWTRDSFIWGSDSFSLAGGFPASFSGFSSLGMNLYVSGKVSDIYKVWYGTLFADEWKSFTFTNVNGYEKTMVDLYGFNTGYGDSIVMKTSSSNLAISDVHVSRLSRPDLAISPNSSQDFNYYGRGCFCTAFGKLFASFGKVGNIFNPGGGLFVSEDGGERFIRVQDITSPYLGLLTFDGDKLYAAGTSHVYESSNGSAWSVSSGSITGNYVSCGSDISGTFFITSDGSGIIKRKKTKRNVVNGSYRFVYRGTWEEDGRTGWVPQYPLGSSDASVITDGTNTLDSSLVYRTPFATNHVATVENDLKNATNVLTTSIMNAVDSMVLEKINAYKNLHYDPVLNVTWTNVVSGGHIYFVTVTNADVSVAQ